MRVVVAEDVMLTREGIVRLLGDAGVDVVGTAEDADGLLRLVQEQHPDVAITDIRMPPTHTDEGLVAATRIRAEFPAPACSCYRSTSSRATRCASSRITPRPWDTCSRSACSTSPCSSMHFVGSQTTRR